MTKKYNHILAKSKRNGNVSLIEHLEHIACVAEAFAEYLGLDKRIARTGAILHDIGKASPVFQERLEPTYKKPLEGHDPYRHELASLLFLHLVNEDIRPQVIDMVVAHHKSILGDKRKYGILDFDDECDNTFELHSKYWNEWHDDALGILEYFGWEVRPINIDEAAQTFQEVVDYCYAKEYGWSIWKGLLVGADHYGSAMIFRTEEQIKKAFKIPTIGFYNRQSELYPLSLVKADDMRKHTIVTAPTGAGKTDFLMRRCKGRIFYTLPFQASINAMYERIRADLKKDNLNLDIRLLHAASRIIVKDDTEEKDLQSLVGASIKVLTPYQLASIVFASKGFETILADLKNCDIILDEIHTYSKVSKAIVLKIIEVLSCFGCRLHIGTATMPSKLYDTVLNILGNKNVYEVKLSKEILDKFDRHTIHKPSDFKSLKPIILKAIVEKQKILIVCNRVVQSQSLFRALADDQDYNGIAKMLIHSRFKRGDRKKLETDLKEVFNENSDACIVVSTQVVEVSLDISFDLMITDAAPLDALIQRFGRINRKRSEETIGHYKPIYILPPPDDEKSAKPYDLEIIKKSYEQLTDGGILHERDVQEKIDAVFTSMEDPTIEQNAKFKDGNFMLKELSHVSKSVLLQSLEIDSVACIVENDIEQYMQSGRDDRIQFEILMRYWSVANKNLEQLEWGSNPFIVPDKSYCNKEGLLQDFIDPKYYDVTRNFI